MSRTDIHRPFWVQTSDPAVRRRLRAVHHHWQHDAWDPALNRWLVVRTAPCDLGDPEGRCQYYPVEPHNPFCGCWICTAQAARRVQRRAERGSIRRQLTAAVQAAAAGERDIDIHTSRAVKW